MINPTSKSCNAYEPILQVLQIIKEWCTVKDGWQAKLVERNLSCVMISSYWWWRRRSWRSWLSDMMLIMQSIPVWCCQCPVREKIISGVWCSPIEKESRTNKCSPDDQMMHQSKRSFQLVWCTGASCSGGERVIAMSELMSGEASAVLQWRYQVHGTLKFPRLRRYPVFIINGDDTLSKSIMV